MRLSLSLEHTEDDIRYNQKCVIPDIVGMSNEEICKYLDELKIRMIEYIEKQTQIRNTNPNKN